MMGKLGIPELLLILVIVVVIFGPKQLPKLAKTFGETIKSFKQGVEEGSEKPEEKTAEKEEAAKASEVSETTKE